MRPPFGYEAQSYIRAAKQLQLPSIDVDPSDLISEDDRPTVPYTPFDRAQLDIPQSYEGDRDTLPSAAFEPETSPWKGAVTGFTHSWVFSLVAAAIILSLAFESTCNR